VVEDESLSSNHFIHASTKLSALLSVLYNSMLVHGISPPAMSAGTIVPIPENKNVSLSDSNNYRSMTLGSVICKIFDLIVLKKEREKLCNSVINNIAQLCSVLSHCCHGDCLILIIMPEVLM
jgi:hypothetical protein